MFSDKSDHIFIEIKNFKRAVYVLVIKKNNFCKVSIQSNFFACVTIPTSFSEVDFYLVYKNLNASLDDVIIINIIIQ